MTAARRIDPFRAVLLGGALALWLLFSWFASHRSSDPSVLGAYSVSYFLLLCGLGGLAGVATAAQLGPVYRRLRRVRRPLIALALSTVAALCLAEVSVRLFDPLGISYYERAKQYHLDKLADPDLVYRHRPSFRRLYEGVEYAFNELGLRDRPIAEKAAGELRVLCVGDSVTLGSGVAVEQTFTRKLEQLLAARLGRPVRTINAGVGSYNTTQELAWLQRDGLALEPDLCLLLYVDNDVELNRGPFDPHAQLSWRGKSPPEVVQLLLGKSRLYRLFVHLGRYGFEAKRLPLDRQSEGWRESMQAVADMAQVTRARGVPFCAVLWRTGHGEQTDALWADLGAVAARAEFPLGDAGTWFGGKDVRALRNSVVDSHPNPDGHTVAADGMLAFLVASGLVPP